MKLLKNTVFTFSDARFIKRETYEDPVDTTPTYRLARFKNQPHFNYSASQEFFREYQIFAQKGKNEHYDSMSQRIVSRMIDDLSTEESFKERVKRLENPPRELRNLTSARVELLITFLDTPTFPAQHQHVVREKIEEILVQTPTKYTKGFDEALEEALKNGGQLPMNFPEDKLKLIQAGFEHEEKLRNMFFLKRWFLSLTENARLVQK